MKFPWILLFVLLSGAAAQDKVTYDDHVLPVFQQACLNCHNPDKTRGGLDLSSYQGALKGGSGGKIVEAGDTGTSLIQVVRHAAEPVMPPEGEKLSNAQIDVLVRWIEGGLLENNASTARKPSKPKFEISPHADPATKPEGPPPMPEHLLLEPPVVTGRAAAIHALAASPWAPLIAVTSQKQILLHHSETLELVGILPFPEGAPTALAFTPDGRYLIVGGGVPGKSGLTVTFDVTTGSRLLSAGMEFDSILAADIRPGFDLVATGGPSRLLKIWNTESGEAVHAIKKHSDWITALDISPDGVLLASGDRNGGVWVWESDSGNEFHTLRAHQAGITAAVFRADSNILATASEDGTLRFWEMNGGSEVKKTDAHPGGVTAFAFARDGSSLSAGRDLSAKCWKPDFGPARDLAKNLPALPTAAALDGDGKRAFVGTAAGLVHVFLTADGKPLGEIPGNPPSIDTRLSEINQAITDGEKKLELATKEVAASTGTRDQARAALEAAQKQLDQALKIHQAAEAGAAGSTDEAILKLAADAKARIGPAEKSLAAKRKDLEQAEQALTTANAASKTAQATFNSLLAARKRWSAAAINTRLIATREAAGTASLEADDSMLQFSEAAAAVTARAASLNRKRSEHAQLTALAAAAESPELAAEITATLAAIEIVIDRELAALRQAEATLRQIRSGLDPTAVHAHEKKQEAESLRRAYLQALQ
jgi:mono/diheme cytochrome c family protein